MNLNGVLGHVKTNSLLSSTMYAPAVDHILFYKITTEPDGVTLRIWESPVNSSGGSASYLYIINHHLASVAEAKARLKTHLSLNGGTLTLDQDLPHKGKVRLMSYPTWNGSDTSEN